MNLEDHRNPNGTYNGVSAMAEVTGMSKETVAGLWKEVQENHQRLRACERHKFIRPSEPQQRRCMCEVCGGWVDRSSADWYDQGLSDAKK